MTEIKTPLALVTEFHLAFDHPVLDRPQIPNKQRQDLRYNLLKEELREFKMAVDQSDIISIMDAFADIQYVLAGAILEFGMGDVFPVIFAEIHRSNMSKACRSEEEALETKTKYEAANPTEGPCHYVERNGLWFVYRTNDMKTIKSINYSPADIEGVLNAARGEGPGQPFPEFPQETPSNIQ